MSIIQKKFQLRCLMLLEQGCSLNNAISEVINEVVEYYRNQNSKNDQLDVVESKYLQFNTNLSADEAFILLRNFSKLVWYLKENTTGETIDSYLGNHKNSSGFFSRLEENSDKFISADRELNSILTKYIQAVNAVIKSINDLCSEEYSQKYFCKREDCVSVQFTGLILKYAYIWDPEIDQTTVLRSRFEKFQRVYKDSIKKSSFYTIAKKRIPFLINIISEEYNTEILVRLRILSALIQRNKNKWNWIELLREVELYIQNNCLDINKVIGSIKTGDINVSR